MGKGVSKEDVKSMTESTSLSKSKVIALQKAFRKKDVDKSGELDEGEFEELIREQMPGITPDKIAFLFNAFDRDGDGTVSFTELCTSIAVVSEGSVEDKLELAFRTFDADGNGSLDKAELTALFTHMVSTAKGLGKEGAHTEDFITGIIGKLDADGDGQVTLEEFVTKGSGTPSVLMLLDV